MIKKVLAIAAATLLAAGCFMGCASSSEETAPADVASASAQTAASASASRAAGATTFALDSEHEIEGLKYEVSSDWTETDAGTMAAYGGSVADDLPFSITVAALDAELVQAAEAADAEPVGALLGALGVDSSGVEEAEFKGTAASKFSGEAENAYQAEGYAIREDDGTMFILLLLSTNISDADVQQMWASFLDTVELPA